ncbi:hypothetical protein NDU88_005003 [Pleurodeles waltl]|uniref:Putative nuclease HARBI1 n=1 Tax=Pleurodeles waltl TaxID=8319 RepID=A0AAV7NL36_PLEWA|nr:hypothetical protein NDU88_005003 [Pleurodeles waltl]
MGGQPQLGLCRLPCPGAQVLPPFATVGAPPVKDPKGPHLLDDGTPNALFLMGADLQKKIHKKSAEDEQEMETYPLYRPLVVLATMEDRHIIPTYRLDGATIQELCAQLEPDLISPIRHPTDIPPLVQALSVLHFLASGYFHETVAMASGISRPMFSNVLTRVLSALMKHMRSYIVFPQVSDLATVKSDFYAMGHIPNIIGAIDGTHIAFVPPQRNEQVYRNRKSFYSLNVQIVCLADQYISHVNAKYPGSVHDAFILRNSSIPYMMSQLQRHRVWLIALRRQVPFLQEDEAGDGCVAVVEPVDCDEGEAEEEDVDNSSTIIQQYFQ